jgi:C4-dicarboxylate-specific signal transduction histidine kinase
LTQSSIWSFVRRYGIAVVLVLTAFVFTLALQSFFPYPFLFLFFGAVMGSAWFGGTAAGLFAVLTSTVIVGYFFVPPFYSFSISTTAEAYFVAFVICALAASWVSAALRRSEESLRRARDQLEVRVSERTAELMKTQGELAHLARVLSMGELTASVAHEISQPLTAVVTHGNACVEWLSANPPNLDKALHTARRIIEDATRAGQVVGRIRALFKKGETARDWFDMNEMIRELTGFLRDEAVRSGVHIQTELAPNLPRVKGDRVQLQQVVLNLMLNSFDAVAGQAPPSKEIVLHSAMVEGTKILVRVEDCGSGLNPAIGEKIFEPFYSTKAQGIGMGLSISRSIVESHDGRLWAEPRPSGGAVFQFTLPIGTTDSDD